MVQPPPIVVCAVICTCAISLQFAPITTWGPTTQYGPIDVPSPITAPSSTRAVGSIVLIKWVQSVNLLGFPVVTATYRRCPVTYGYAVFRQVGPTSPSSVRQHRANVGLGNRYTVDDGVAVKPPHGLAATDAAHVVFDGIAGHHRLAELALVNGEKIDRARLLGAFDRQDADDAGGLRHGLDHHHTRIDRALRKMPLKCGLVEGDVLDTNAAVVAADVDDPIDQQHRVAMRQCLEDGIDVHQLKSDRCVRHSRPSPLSAVPSRTRRSTAMISRNHCLVGLAK